MSKKKLAGIIIGCTIAIIVVIVLVKVLDDGGQNGTSLLPDLLSPITYSLSISISPSGAGSVSPSSGEYESGTQVTLTANPASGYQFVSWSGDASGISSTIIITMNSNRDVIATFERLEQIIFEVNNIVLSGGYYQALPLNGIYLEKDQTVTLSWSADDNLEGYIFTETQFNNFKPLGIPSGYEAYSTGEDGTISAYIQHNDTYYGVVTNRVTLMPNVKLYEATLTLR